MSDTPRTDAAVLDEHDPACAVGHLCRQLERELTAAQAEIAKLQERVKNLVTLGNNMADHYSDVAVDSDDDKRIDDWREAAEECQ